MLFTLTQIKFILQTFLVQKIGLKQMLKYCGLGLENFP